MHSWFGSRVTWMFMSTQYSWVWVMLPTTWTHGYSCYAWRVLMNIHVIWTWIFTLPVTCAHEFVTREVYSWIFMLPMTCTHEYLCYPWHDSWIFMLPVTSHEYSYYQWRLMNIHITSDVYLWIFKLSCRGKMNIQITRDVLILWIFIKLPTCILNINITRSRSYWVWFSSKINLLLW